MKGMLKSLGLGAVFSIVSALGVGLLTAAVLCLWKVANASGYMAVLSFIVAVLCIMGAGRVMYGIGACFENVKK